VSPLNVTCVTPVARNLTETANALDRIGAESTANMTTGFHVVANTKARIMRSEATMRAPYGLEIIENCISCPYRQDRLFCNLPPDGVKRLDEITTSATYPKGAALFVQGQSGRGVFILCTGHVKLSTSSADGKTLILKVAEPGDILGLPSTISGKPYEASADVLEACQANFISRVDFLTFLRDYGDAALRVAQELSEKYQSALDELKNIGLSHSASEKLARFLLDWAARQKPGADSAKITLALTHEEIAQMIGASRETVTRLFADFKKKKFLEVKGSSFTIKNKNGLEQLVAGS
jgi:CRP/FNR family cyclic AMP-dependent transcriptional regulator